MTVLGIDPGTRVTGYGVVERTGGTPRLIECGVIRTRSERPLASRLLDIHRGVLELLERHRPACVAVEGVFSGRNARTAMVLGHARGVIVLAAAMHDLPLFEYPPAEVKKAIVGAGAASKTQIAYMVQRHLSLRDAPRPADAADGCAIALCHLLRQGAPDPSRAFQPL